MTPTQLLIRRLVSAAFTGAGSYLRSIAAAESWVRRDRFMRLATPIVPEVAFLAAIRTQRAESGRTSYGWGCIPFYLMPVVGAAYFVFLRPRVQAGPRAKHPVRVRRLGVALTAVGILVKPSVFPRSRSNVLLSVAAPIVGEAIEEAVEPRNAKLAGVLSLVAAGAITLLSTRREIQSLRDVDGGMGRPDEGSSA